MREIGSEFWKTRKLHIRNDETIYLSGRTALDMIVKDAVKACGITSALLPSYCCHTMIMPFRSNGISVRFYDVYINEDSIMIADVPSPKVGEMLYIMKYFGDIDLCYEGEGRNLSGWAVSVEDLTHSCFSKEFFNMEGSMGHTAGSSKGMYATDGNSAGLTESDYWLTSYRKWFGVTGIAVAGKRNGKLPEPSRGQNRGYSDLRAKAFSLKQQFMDGKTVEKQDFLDIFDQAEKLLGKDYKDFGVGYEEVYDLFLFLDRIKDIRYKRRANAKLLFKGLAGVKGIKWLGDFSDENKCPLFVPVIIEDGMRDSLRKYLISKDIYCPVHWVLSDQHKGLSERALKIYGQELSLVCDQRYDAEDMERTITSIKEFLMR